MKKPEISFYQLKVTPLEKALPPLLDKVYGRGLRALVVVDSPERLGSLDSSLWTYSSAAFLPHGFRGDPADHPIWLSLTPDNTNKADVLVITNGEKYPENQNYTRIIDIFDGNTSLDSAINRYRVYKEKDLPLQYWQQSIDGRWVQETH